MKKANPWSTTLRFPLLFGGFMGFMAFAFIYRESWLGDIEAEREKLYKQNADSKLIEEFKRKHGK